MFGVFPLIGGCLALILPETLRQKMPDTIEEAEKMGKYDKDFSAEVTMSRD